MKIEQTSSNGYRIRKMYKGKLYLISVDHKPTQKEAALLLADALENGVTKAESGTFEDYANKYIDSRTNVISPGSIRTYNDYIRIYLSDTFKSKMFFDITQEDVQNEINRFALNHAPKTTQSLHGFIASVIGLYRPKMALKTTLPKKIKQERYLPSDDDVRRILDASIGTDEHIPFQLGVLSLRRAEISALTLRDLRGNELTINKDLVFDKNNKWVIKPTPKTDNSNRTIVLPQKLVDEINERGYIYNKSPQKINNNLHKYQDELGIERFRFHDMRHYFASYAHSLGICDADILAMGGWKTDHVMKSVYRESMEKSRKESMQKIVHSLL